MVYRHSIVTRITHAVFSLAFLGLALTGTQIFFHLHWLHFKVGALHQYLGLAMIASGAVYFSSSMATGELSKLLFGPGDAAGLLPMIAYYARFRSSPPAYDGYNPLQKLAYTVVLLTMGPLIAATGVAMWTKTGGRAMSIFHIGFAVELLLVFIGHMLMVATTGLRNNIHAIVTGWYLEPAKRARVIREDYIPQVSPAVRISVEKASS